jgi:hypothetical protein
MMPIFLEPDQTFEVSLEIDKEKPIATRPVFLVKSQSMRGQRKIMEAIDMLHVDGVTVSQVFDATIAQLERCLVGWRNMAIDFATDKIEDILNYNEATELLRKIAYNQKMSGDEKK